MDGKSAKDSAAPASQPQLHKKMLQLLSSLWVTRAVGTFARLGLADVMAQGIEDHAAIAAARGLVPDRVYRLLRALSTVGVVSEPERGRFVLTPLGRLLGAEASGSMRTTAIYLNDYFADMWVHLDDAMAGERTAFEALKGRPFFDWLGEQPAEAQRFNRMMYEVHGPETPAIVAAYDFSAFGHIVDIGGGNGALLSAILAAYPDRRATLFDMAEAVAAAKRGEGGPLPGVNFVTGNVFETAPADGDAYLIRHLLHDYDDPECLKILGHVRRAMQAGGARAGAGGAAAVRRQPRSWPLARSAGPGAVRRSRTHGRRIRSPVRASRLRLSRTIPTRHPAMTIVEAVAADAPRA